MLLKTSFPLLKKYLATCVGDISRTESLKQVRDMIQKTHHFPCMYTDKPFGLKLSTLNTALIFNTEKKSLVS